MERWDHASLLAAGSSPCGSPLKSKGPASSLGEPDSPLGEGWEFELVDRRALLRDQEPAIKHSGWLLKAQGDGPQRAWRRRFVWVTADRLCYTPDPDVEGVRYLPMDRIPVRALPRGYGPKLGVTLVEDRQARTPGLHACRSLPLPGAVPLPKLVLPGLLGLRPAPSCNP